MLNLPATASAEEIERALDAEDARLRENTALPPVDRDERQRMLARARMVLCDEQNRMMYDIMGKDVSADESWIAPESRAVVPAPAPPSISPAPPASPESAVHPAGVPAPDRPKTQRELDAEMELKRISMELQLRAERLHEGEGEKKPFFRTRMGRITIAFVVCSIVSSIISLIASRMMLP